MPSFAGLVADIRWPCVDDRPAGLEAVVVAAGVFADDRNPSDRQCKRDGLLEAEAVHPIHPLNHLNHQDRDVVHPFHRRCYRLVPADSRDTAFVVALDVALCDVLPHRKECPVGGPCLVVLRDRICSTDHWK